MSTKIRAIVLRNACILVALMPIVEKTMVTAIVWSASILVALKPTVAETIPRAFVWNAIILVALGSIAAETIVTVIVWSKSILVALGPIVAQSIVRVIKKQLSNGAGTLYYDSCVDNALKPKMFIVFDIEHFYPEYVIQY